MSESRSRILLLAIALSLAGCATAEQSLDGEVIYANRCARCHGADLAGGSGPALGAGSEAAAKDDEHYRTVIVGGRGAMPAFRSLSDQQVDAVINYLRTEQG